MKLNNYDLWKMINLCGTLAITTLSIFQPVNLLYAVIMLLMAIFLAIEDKQVIHIHIYNQNDIED